MQHREGAHPYPQGRLHLSGSGTLRTTAVLSEGVPAPPGWPVAGPREPPPARHAGGAAVKGMYQGGAVVLGGEGVRVARGKGGKASGWRGGRRQGGEGASLIGGFFLATLSRGSAADAFVGLPCSRILHRWIGIGVG